MPLERPSRTAWGAALHRAAHQIFEGGQVFADPLAIRILGAQGESAARQKGEGPWSRRLRLFIAVRARFAEDALRASVAKGVLQYVILGAGLDTFAYRSDLSTRIRVFEVDHPETQGWKRALLREAGIAEAGSVTFAPIDFEKSTLSAGLLEAGFDPGMQSFFSWLGVVPYLTEDAVFSTLGFIAGLPGGAHVVFDYGNPPADDDLEDAAQQKALADRVALAGEPFRCLLETDALHARLGALGFRNIEDLGPSSIRQRYFGLKDPPVRDRGGHILRATTR